MFKKIKELFVLTSKVDNIQLSIDNLSDQVNSVSTIKKPTRYQEIHLNEEITDYEQLRSMFESKYHKDALNKYAGIQENLQECIVQYDKVLYFNKDSINYIELTSRLYELYVLRSFILDILFKTDDIESFYFYAINNSTFYNIVSNISYIDMEKIFLLDEEKDLDMTYYTIINMRNNNIIIVTPSGDYEIENKYRKTVVRALYSIYFEKYFLYHLKNETGETI